MKAIVVRQFGGSEVLKFEELSKPEIGPVPAGDSGRILVKIEAAGVNPFDTYMRSGTYAIRPEIPYTPGADAAGIVEALSPGVKAIKPGQRVYIANATIGAYAEYAVFSETLVHPLPDHLSFSQGAAIGVPYATAYHALVHQAAAKAGQTLLIHGASGGVGIAVVQIAKALGLTVLGTAGSDAGVELVRREGAHQVWNHKAEGYTEAIVGFTNNRGVDIVVEMRADLNLGNDFRLVAPGGRIVVVGSRGETTVNPRDLMNRYASVHGFTLPKAPPEELKEIWAGIGAGLENRTLHPVVGLEFPLIDARQAQERVLEPGAFGKIVLVP